MAKKKYTEQDLDIIAQLKSSNEMFIKSINDAREHGNEKGVKRLEEAREDVLDQLKKIDPQLEKEERAKLSLFNNDEEDEIIVKKVTNDKKSTRIKSVYDVIEEEKAKETTKTSTIVEDDEENEDTVSEIISYSPIDTDEQYDIIQLPSNGECYKEKIRRLAVGYITAFDENLITSPNLYRDGMILDFLIKNKVLTEDFDVDNLCVGDADAVVLFLRLTSYGEEYPVTVTDPETREQFDTVIDLSKIKYKEFKLKGDENGYFDFQLPVSKDLIKFRYLTRKDVKNLNFLNKIENEKVKASTIRENVKALKNIVKQDKTLYNKEKQGIYTNLEELNKLAEKLEQGNPTPYSKIITNKLEMSIVSVNGEEDREYIAKYIRMMSARDSLMLRRYITENEPSVDFEVEVERPESLGGGSFKTFLEWDETVFLNFA